MPRFSANLSMLFCEQPLADRFDAAAHAGFAGVEIQFPYDHPAPLLAARARAAATEVVLFNLPLGASPEDRSLNCDPARHAAFRAGLARTLDYAAELGCRRINCLAGVVPEGVPREAALAAYRDNLREAARAFAPAGITLVIEPINTRTVPGFLLDGSAQAITLIQELGEPNIRVQFDFFHMQIMQGDLAGTLARELPWIGHIQFADVPQRHEPGTGSGEIAFSHVFDRLDALRYDGWVGAEYVPSRRTEDTLGWFAPYRAAQRAVQPATQP